MDAKPFVKWAGGKTQLLPIIQAKYPQNKKKYCEPFIGGGAILFDVLQTLKPEEVLINDINKELINTYKTIKEAPNELIAFLEGIQESYYLKNEAEKKDFFYTQRNLFNETKINNPISVVKAGLFIFLNKTCFNGLYRVNSKGLFNVPFNNAKKPLICDNDNILKCSELLQNVNITTGSYKDTSNFIDSNTFVYIDPPYRPLKQSSFTSYNENDFTDQNQEELKDFVVEINNIGAFFLESNSDPKNTNIEDNFFDDLYRDFNIERVFASRMINSKSSGRGNITELLISNY